MEQSNEKKICMTAENWLRHGFSICKLLYSVAGHFSRGSGMGRLYSLDTKLAALAVRNLPFEIILYMPVH